jgi:hypothetical protein
MIAATPDMLAHLRSMTDPLKGTDYAAKASSVGGGSRLHAPPPVPVELLDAPDFIVTVLWSTREVVQGRIPQGRMQVPVRAGAVVLRDFAEDVVAEILAGLPGLSEREEIVPLADAVLGAPASRDEWTLRTIFDRWSLREGPWWAVQPCPVPSCGLRAVKVTPPGVPGDETRYECAKCGWQAPADDDGFWAEVFSRREGAV